MRDFRIADTFTDSLARLTGDERKSVKTTAFDLQMNPANPGMSLHRLDKVKDANLWSVRVGSDIRLIVHKTPASLLLCCVGSAVRHVCWKHNANGCGACLPGSGRNCKAKAGNSVGHPANWIAPAPR